MDHIKRISAPIKTRLRNLQLIIEEIAISLRLANRVPGYFHLDQSSLSETRLTSWKLREKSGLHLYTSSDAQTSTLAFFKLIHPNFENMIIFDANLIREHTFDLLGSGPTSLGEKIDWHAEFKSGHRWDPHTYYKRHRPAPYPGGYDIKVPWELSRCQHFVRLGQAYWITNDEKYAREFAVQIVDWIESNPWPWGVNWTCTMDVAIRAVNWLLGFVFFEESSNLSDEVRMAFFNSMHTHGRHIIRNLENRRKPAGNHYLANLVGLVHLGILCPDFKEAQKWREFGLRELEQEMFNQVYPDGGDFESSTSYHRLVLEMFLSATLLAQRNGHTFSDNYLYRLEKMIEYVMYITMPDGTVPLIGDNDNGRLYRLKVWNPPEKEWVDFRYLLAVGALLFRRPDFARAAGDQWEEAVWFFGEDALTFKKEAASNHASSPLGSWSFPESGLYVMRHEDLYLAVTDGRKGRYGIGGHNHNDSMSIVLHSDNYTWIIDPGSYIYTADYEARNLFRSTAYHNVVVIRDLEQNRFLPDQLFGLQNDSQPAVHAWKDCDDHTLFDGSYRLSTKDRQFHHRRQIFLDKSAGIWIVRDKIEGEGYSPLKWRWHMAPTTEVQPGDPWILSSPGKKQILHIKLLTSTHIPECFIEESWVSIGYGNRHESTTLGAAMETRLPVELTWVFVPCKNVEEISAEITHQACERFQETLLELGGERF
jgi:hypothetical protein